VLVDAYSSDLSFAPRLVQCDINNSFISTHHCHHDDIVQLQIDHYSRFLVLNWGDHDIGITLCLRYPDLGQGLLGKSTLLSAEKISWTILCGSSNLSSFLRIRRQSAKLKPLVRAAAGLACFICFKGKTLSYSLVGGCTDVVTSVTSNLGITIVVSVGTGIGVSFGFKLSCLPD